MERPDELLAQLRDIHLPLTELPLAALAQAAAPVLLAIGILALLLGWAWRHWQGRPQQVALRRLRDLQRQHELDGNATALAQGVATLLRQQALHRYPDAPVAGLVEGEWLSFLDTHGGNNGFSRGVGATLTRLPYQPVATLPPGEASALITLAQQWLRANPI